MPFHRPWRGYSAAGLFGTPFFPGRPSAFDNITMRLSLALRFARHRDGLGLCLRKNVPSLKSGQTHMQVAWKGSALEDVLANGVTGFSVSCMDSAVEVMAKAKSLDCRAIRDHFVDTFTVRHVADATIALCMTI